MTPNPMDPEGVGEGASNSGVSGSGSGTLGPTEPTRILPSRPGTQSSSFDGPTRIVSPPSGSGAAGSAAGGGQGAAGPAMEANVLVGGRYRILGEVARGGMGVVYRAHDQGLDRKVALKVCTLGGMATESELQRFQNEARTLARLSHPNLLPIYDIGMQGGLPFYTMELIQGTDLSHLVHEKGPLSPSDALSVCGNVAEALDVVHQAGIIHRDLKPANIMIRQDGRPVLMDFGLVKVEGSELTQSGSVLGTPKYMAPEQIDPQPGFDLDTRADIYALGAVLYFLLAGSAPHEGESVVQILKRKVLDRPKPIAELRGEPVPEAVEALCMDCLEIDRDQRPPTCAAFVERADAILASPSALRPADPAQKKVRKLAAHVLVGSVVLALVVAFLAYRTFGPRAAGRGGGGVVVARAPEERSTKDGATVSDKAGKKKGRAESGDPHASVELEESLQTEGEDAPSSEAHRRLPLAAENAAPAEAGLAGPMEKAETKASRERSVLGLLAGSSDPVSILRQVAVADEERGLLPDESSSIRTWANAELRRLEDGGNDLAYGLFWAWADHLVGGDGLHALDPLVRQAIVDGEMEIRNAIEGGTLDPCVESLRGRGFFEVLAYYASEDSEGAEADKSPADLAPAFLETTLRYGRFLTEILRAEKQGVDLACTHKRHLLVAEEGEVQFEIPWKREGDEVLFREGGFVKRRAVPGDPRLRLAIFAEGRHPSFGLEAAVLTACHLGIGEWLAEVHVRAGAVEPAVIEQLRGRYGYWVEPYLDEIQDAREHVAPADHESLPALLARLHEMDEAIADGMAVYEKKRAPGQALEKLKARFKEREKLAEETLDALAQTLDCDLALPDLVESEKLRERLRGWHAVNGLLRGGTLPIGLYRGR